MPVIRLNEILRTPITNTSPSCSLDMSLWRDETHTDLVNAKERMSALIREISGEPTTDQVRSIWRAYLEVEKSILFIKVEIDEENPGRFVKWRAYVVPDERQALQFAMKSLVKGIESFNVGDYKRSLHDLRDARNYLRVLLKAKRVAGNREKSPAPRG